MSSMSRNLRSFLKLSQLREISRKLFSSDTNTTAASKAKAKSKQPEPSVSGLSSKVLNVPSTAAEMGPGASKAGKYKNPEYFCYHQTSYFDAEIEMAKYRLPQPSAK